MSRAGAGGPRLPRAAVAWETPDFAAVFREEVTGLDRSCLPLQAGLSQSSHVDDSRIDVVVLGSHADEREIEVRAGIFYAGIIAGSCCADDPTPVEPQPEYCQLRFRIDRRDGAARIELLDA